MAAATSGITERDLAEVSRLLLEIPSPAGRERPLAEAVQVWGRRAAPHLTWDVVGLGGESANLVGRSSFGPRRPELGFYTHLDTSLTADPAIDGLVVPALTPPDAAPAADTGTGLVRGHGLGVSKGPAACALVAFVAATEAFHRAQMPHRVSLLLSAGGTHRGAPPERRHQFDPLTVGLGSGVEAALRGGYRPRAVVNVKGAADGILFEEPGCALLRVRVQGAWLPALLRDQAVPPGGILTRVGEVVDAIESWRADYSHRDVREGSQLGRDAAIGAVEGGLPYKPDLVPGVLHVYVYAVLVPGDDPMAIVADLEAALHAATPELDVAVDCYGFEPPGRTDPDTDIIRLATDLWEREHGAGSAQVEAWRGSTDGALLRAAGIDTVRFGFGTEPDPDDPRMETVEIQTMMRFARLYAELAACYVGQAHTDVPEARQ